MALPTSGQGHFKITALAFTPAVIAMGETTQFSITIQNTSGKSVSSCYVTMSGTYPSTNGPNGMGYFSTIYLHGGPNFDMASISWGNNVSRTFTGSFTCSKGFYELDASNYVLSRSLTSLSVSIATNAEFSDGSNSDYFSNLCGSSGEYLTVLSKRDNPRLSFDMERYPDDEAASVSTSIRLASDVTNSVFQSRGYSAKLYYSSAHSPATPTDNEATLNSTIAQMLAGVTNSTTAISTTFSNGSDWHFLLVVSNGYERSTAACSIPRAFANLHMSGCTTGGACFGGFSTSTENNPKLESYYPAYLYGGIAQVGDSSSDLLTMLGIQRGAHSAQNVSSSATAEVSVTFPKAYAETPVVIANIESASTSYYLGRCNVAIQSVTNTGFTARLANGGSSTVSFGFHWAALGKLAAGDVPVIVTRPAGAMSANSSLGCVASASTTYSSSYPAWRAFNGSSDTSWASSNSDGAPWIQLQMDVALKNIKVSVYSRSQNASAGNHNPTSGTVQGSNNGTSWTQIGTYSGWPGKNDGTLLGTIDCKNAVAYKYVRINIATHAGSDYASIGNISIRGEI